MTLRSITEKVTRSWVYKRKLPTEFGNKEIFVSPTGGLRYLFQPMHQIDPTLFNFIKEFVKEDQIVWDIGANLGLFSFTSAYQVGSGGKIYAIEPDSELVTILRRSTSIQTADMGQVQVIPAAVAEAVDLRSFAIAVRTSSTNHLVEYGSSQTGGIREQQTVVTLTLDWLAEKLPLPDILKIDVEGAELEVLKGATKLLSKHKPIVLCEVAIEIADPVTDFFHHFDYELFDAEQPARDRKPIKAATFMTLAIPKNFIWETSKQA